MNRILRRYLCIVMSVTIIVILAANYILTGENLRREAYSRFVYVLNQIEKTLEANKTEMQEIEDSLFREYLTKTNALAMLIKERPQVLNSQKELGQLRELLDVDELCITDGAGVIRYALNPSYIGLDFHEHEQTRFFLPILEDPGIELVQGIEYNAAHGEEFQYAGVGRLDAKGIVQIGMKPVRLKQAQARCTYPYLFSRVPLDADENIFAIDIEKQEVLAHSREELVGKKLDEIPEVTSAGIEDFLELQDGGYTLGQGIERYTATRRIDGVVVGLSVPKNTMYKQRKPQMEQTAAYLVLACLVAIIMLNYLLRTRFVKAIKSINESLGKIEKGNYSLVVDERGTPEFAMLSDSINHMVDRLVGVSGKISRIIDTTGVDFAAFEYNRTTGHLMLTDNAEQVLGLDEEEVDRMRREGNRFLEYIDMIMKEPVEEGSNIYRLNTTPERWVRIALSQTPESMAGTVMDISDDMQKRLEVEYERDHDALTGLKNYKLFQDLTAGYMVAYSRKAAAGVMIDLDNFKEINDTWGHNFGDIYLQKTAGLLRNLEQPGVITARRAGDEFSIFFYGWNTREEIRDIFYEFSETINTSVITLPDGALKNIYASCGLAWARPGESFRELMHNADNALYQAKKSRRGRIIEYEESENSIR